MDTIENGRLIASDNESSRDNQAAVHISRNLTIDKWINQAAVHISRNPTFDEWIKHIDIKDFLRTAYTPWKKLIDIFTKSLLGDVLVQAWHGNCTIWGML